MSSLLSTGNTITRPVNILSKAMPPQPHISSRPRRSAAARYVWKTSRADRKQGDLAFLDILARMGCTVGEGEDWLEVSGTSELRGVEVDLRDIPDTAQTLAAIAPFATTPTSLRGIASARLKGNRSRDGCV